MRLAKRFKPMNIKKDASEIADNADPGVEIAFLVSRFGRSGIRKMMQITCICGEMRMSECPKDPCAAVSAGIRR